MGSWFGVVIQAVAQFFVGTFQKALPSLETEAKTEFATIETSVVTFVKTDVGKLAVDAVNMAKAKGESGDAAFATAKAQFIADAKAAGHDLENVGLGIVDWMIQTAYTFVAGTVAQLPGTVTPAA